MEVPDLEWRLAPDCEPRGSPRVGENRGPALGYGRSNDRRDTVTNKTPEEERIQKEQEARDKEKAKEEAAEERRLE